MAYAFVILNSIILVVTVILCSIAIPLLVLDKKSRKVIRNFLLSLCISDLVRVVLGSGFIIRDGIGLKVTDASCPYEVIPFATSQIASALVSAVTSVDRYFAISYPLEYRKMMTEKVSYIVIGISWTVILVIGSTYVVFQKRFEELPVQVQDNLSFISCLQAECTVKEGIFLFSEFGVILPSMMVIIFTNIRVYSIMKRVHKINAHRMSFYSWFKNGFGDGEKQANAARGQLKRREIRASFIILLSVINFMAVWIPAICLRGASIFWKIRFSETCIYTILTVLQIYSLVNPFLYIFTIKRHKETLQRLLGRVFCCNSEDATLKGNQMDTESS